MPYRVRVASAHEAAELDAAAIAGGVPSRALMRTAASNAASIIARRYAEQLHNGVVVYTGPGNNGGDGWCVARCLAQTGIRVRVAEIVAASSPDAIAEREAALPHVTVSQLGHEPVIIDALLGSGAHDTPRSAIADAIKDINARKSHGATVIALDGPTGLDATTGHDCGSVRADLSIVFGTLKRGHLVSRAVCGTIVLVDIGLDVTGYGEADTKRIPLVDRAFVAAHVPSIPADAHKGARKRLVIVGGAEGMGGAPILAAQAALRSGIGLVRVVTCDRNLSAVQAVLPEALTATFPRNSSDDQALFDNAACVLIGPGLGHDDAMRDRVIRILNAWRGPVVLDADGLNMFAEHCEQLQSLLQGRPAILTPHPLEFSRLAGVDVATVLENRFDIGMPLARELGATILLKGTPTVVFGAGGERFISAAGTPSLATAGSGDVLSGIVATLLAQEVPSLRAAACAAWAHGRAAERCTLRGARGVTLRKVLKELANVWQESAPSPAYPVLAELPAIV